jgi:16S rRNA (uracil1498-N3)-methyltransferase
MKEPMELFYIEQFGPDTASLVLSREESHHAKKVLRKKAGDPIDLTDGKGHHIRGRIRQIKQTELIIDIVSYKELPFPSENRIEVGLSVIRPNRLDWAVEKCTELGVQMIVPLICRYSSSRQVKLKHLQKIMVSAIKQSSRFHLPEIAPVTKFSEWMEGISKSSGRKFLAHPEGSSEIFDLADRTKTDFIYLAIGPEGGFSEEELQMAQEKGVEKLQLGKSILRTETAAVVALCQLKSLLIKNSGDSKR